MEWLGVYGDETYILYLEHHLKAAIKIIQNEHGLTEQEVVEWLNCYQRLEDEAA